MKILTHRAPEGVVLRSPLLVFPDALIGNSSALFCGVDKELFLPFHTPFMKVYRNPMQSSSSDTLTQSLFLRQNATQARISPTLRRRSVDKSLSDSSKVRPNVTWHFCFSSFTYCKWITPSTLMTSLWIGKSFPSMYRESRQICIRFSRLSAQFCLGNCKCGRIGIAPRQRGGTHKSTKSSSRPDDPPSIVGMKEIIFNS